MMKRERILFGLIATAAILLFGVSTNQVIAHGDVTPQAVNTDALPDIGAAWLKSNPYRGNAKAIEIGKSAYNQNCAR